MYKHLVNPYLYNWIMRRHVAEQGPITLTQRRIFILPTRQGLIFGTAILLMLVGSINYGVSLGFMLTFLLAGMAVVSVLHTFRNLARLQLKRGKADAVFAGETASFSIVVSNPSSLGRYGIVLDHESGALQSIDLEAGASVLINFDISAPRRGVLSFGKLKICTTFPLGLFRAWSNIELAMQCLIYPTPETVSQTMFSTVASQGTGTTRALDGDDFFGLRNHQVGDSRRHIAWRATARTHVLLTKQFGGATDTQLWFDWKDLPRSMDIEHKLSRLTRWVIDAHQEGKTFGLRLPNRTINPGNNESHLRLCLEALALFDLPNNHAN